MTAGAVFSSENDSTPFFLFRDKKLLHSASAIVPGDEILMMTQSETGIMDKVTVNIARGLADGTLTIHLTTENPPRQAKVDVAPGQLYPLPGYSGIQVGMG